jgi:hypothetical protein
VFWLFWLPLLLACAPATGPAAPSQTLEPDIAIGPASTRHLLTYVPSVIDDGSTEYFEESGGEMHFIVGRMRMTRRENGGLEASREALADGVRSVTHLPDHLGAGWIFHNESLAYFAARFSGPLVALTRTSGGLKIGTGPDAFYTFGPYQGFSARDPKTGAPAPKPVLPPLPEIDQIFAVSERAVVATGPVVGTVKSVDGGRTWQRVEFDDAPLSLSQVGSNVVLSLDRSAEQWFGSTPPKVYSFRPRVLLPDGSWGDDEGRTVKQAIPKISDALRAGVLRGWPLANGTVVFAESGDLVRVSIQTGEVIERAKRAFDSPRATCSPVGLATPRDAKAFGFVCGTRLGKTDIYRYENNGLTLVRSFADPRIVRSSDNGRLVIEGGCDTSSANTRRSLCVLEASGAVHAFELSGAGGDARPVALSDGRLALVTPPTARSLPTLTLIGGSRAKRISLKWPSAKKDEQEMLQKGAWLEDFQERRPGVIGGWIDRRGHVLGFEIDVDGTLRMGQLIYELGKTVVNGRFGLGWLPSKRGYETTDGGMNWKAVALPTPLAQSRELACGPVGCANAGWLRVGWGPIGEGAGELRQPDAIARPAVARKSLSLQCEALSKPRHSVSRSEDRYSRPGVGQPPPTKFGVFAGEPGPVVKVGERGFTIETAETVYADRNMSGSGRVFAWGDPNLTPHWQAKWMMLGSSKVYSSRVTAAPAATLEGLRTALGAQRYTSTWFFIAGETPGRALMVGKRPLETVVLAVVDGQPITEVRRPDGSRFQSFLAALEHSGTIALLEQSAAHEMSLWVIDGAGARVTARYRHRSGTQVRLARHTADGRIGMLMTTTQRQPLDEWLFAPTEGTWTWPAPLGSRYAMTQRFCEKGEVGWRTKTPIEQTIYLTDPRSAPFSITGGTASMLAKEGDGCYEALVLRGTAGDLDTFDKGHLAVVKGEATGGAPTIPVALVAGDARLELLCRPHLQDRKASRTPWP